MKFSNLTKILKEPIVQFTLLGALIFGIDHMLVVNRDDPKNIVIDDNQIKQLVQIFEEGQGRTPSGREINNMVIAWSQNEILYREAKRMGLDRGDDMIRNRLVLKIRNVLFNNVAISNPEEAQLQEFFEITKANYSIPERYDIEMIALPADYDQEAAQAVLDSSLSEGVPEAYLGSRYEYLNRREENLVEMFGAKDSATILSEEENDSGWMLISPQQRHHLVRIIATHEAVEPSLKSVRSRVLQDYERYAADLQISEQTHSIARQYRVHLDVSDDYLDKMENDLPRNPFEDTPEVSVKPETGGKLLSDMTVDGR